MRNPETDIQPLTGDQLSQYFERVKLMEGRETLQPNLHLLCKIQWAHVQQVPYENLSLHLDKVSRRFESCRCVQLKLNDE